MGLPALSLLENITSSVAPVELLKLGLTYPWPSAKVEEFLRSHDEVLIVEELDRILEQELKSFVLDHAIPVRLHARVGDEELMGEMTPGRTWTLLARIWPDLFPPCPAHEPGPAVTPRIPQMCPGCGHRSAYHAIKSALPPNAITVADIGCHTLGFFEPYDIGKVLLCMGHSTGTAAGLRLFNQERKVVCFLGDSTYFHAGIPGVVNAVANDHDITLILMENDTTAMTGHQPLASSPEQGERRISIEETLKSLNVKFIRNVDTYRQAELAQAVREAMEHTGFSVVIARHPCMLQFTKRQMRKGAFKPVQVQVDQQVCDKQHVCTGDFGCPSFVLHEDGTVTVHPDLCIGDGSCRQTCPTQALIQPRGGKDNA
jgi:indolepyruvate ferredoxin oxidoreductase alpha subunit